MEEQCIVAFVRASHGVSGECRLESTSGKYEHLQKLSSVVLRHGEKTKSCTIVSSRLLHNSMLVQFREITSLEEMQNYSGWEVVVPKAFAYQAQEGEWYVDDLKGCTLLFKSDDGSLTNVGLVKAVLEGGASELLEVDVFEAKANEVCVGKKKARTVYVPFSDEYIGDVDIKNKTLMLKHLWIVEL